MVADVVQTLADEVQTLAGIRAIIVAAQVLLIHIGKQQRIPKIPLRYFKTALHDPNNPDYRNMLESVFGAVESISKSKWTDRLDAMIDGTNLEAHPSDESDPGELSNEAAKLTKILQHSVSKGICLQQLEDEQTALDVPSRYQQVSNAQNKAKLIHLNPTSSS